MADQLMSAALIGAGRWGQQLLRVFEGRCRLARVCHRGSLQTSAWLDRHYPHLAHTTNYETVLDDPTIESVIIATPIATHASLARAALEAGKHVFVEKPLAMNRAEARELMERAAARQRVLFVGHVFLYHPALEKLRQLTAADPIQTGVMSWQKLGTFGEDLFWNLLSHEVAIATVLFGGEPEEATVLYRQGFVTSCDAAAIRLQFSSDRECVVELNRCASSRSKRVTVRTAGGRILVWENDRLLQLGANEVWEPLECLAEEPLAREAEAFMTQVRAGHGSAPDTALAVGVVETIERLLATHGSVPRDTVSWSRMD